ncbi:MAG: zinc ribbon domain-containing protein [Deltaproteobacteria bacterium]|nr:zinc ribbon domain-containing protein [Deltaproteobacteria bacterium]
MPIYEYRCNSCGRQFELTRKFSDKPLKKCIDCSGPVEKLISLSSFHLKGSGWYATDYAGKGKAEEKPAGCKDSAKKPECSGCPSAS